MNSADVRELFAREPFEPLRIRLSSGDSYEVRNPDLVVLMRSRLFLAFPGSDRWTLIPYLHIAAVETLTNGASGRRRYRS